MNIILRQYVIYCVEYSTDTKTYQLVRNVLPYLCRTVRNKPSVKKKIIGKEKPCVNLGDLNENFISL